VGRSRKIVRRRCDRIWAFLHRHHLRSEEAMRLRSYRNLLLFGDTLHGPTVIAHPLAGEKRAGQGSRVHLGRHRPKRERAENEQFRSEGKLETYGPEGASFKCRMR
jgi:hypothetical protein